MIWRCRDFDIKGLSTQGPYTLELEKVFVELSIIPRSTPEECKNPIAHLPKSFIQKSHVVWDFLRLKNLSWHNFVIIGPPGSGKTTMLKHMVITLALGKQRRKLAIECEQEALTVEEKTRSKLKKLLEKEIEDKDTSRRKIIAEALLSKRIH